MTPEQLTELKRLESAATQREWKVRIYEGVRIDSIQSVEMTTDITKITASNGFGNVGKPHSRRFRKRCETQ